MIHFACDKHGKAPQTKNSSSGFSLSLHVIMSLTQAHSLLP